MRVLPRLPLLLGILLAGLVLPLPALPPLLLATVLLLPATGAPLRRLRYLVPLGVLVVLFNGLLVPTLYGALGWSLPWDPWRVGVLTALRLAIFATAAAWFAATTAPREILPLVARLPRAGMVLVGATRFAPLLERDARRIREAQRARGHDPGGGLRGALGTAPLLNPLLVRTLRRGVTAGQALRARGFPDADRLPWGPLMALAALAAASRMAFAWLPNVTPLYLVVFLAGLAYGARVGALTGVLSMLATDVLLSGLHPVLVVNSLAMGLVGAAGGLLRPLDLARGGEPLPFVLGVTATAGALSVLLFSVASDTLTFVLFYGAGAGVWDPHAWLTLVGLGLVFNVLPAAVNAALFAAATAPALHALRRAGLVDAPRERVAGARATGAGDPLHRNP